MKIPGQVTTTGNINGASSALEQASLVDETAKGPHRQTVIVGRQDGEKERERAQSSITQLTVDR